MIVLGQIMAGICNGKYTEDAKYRHEQRERRSVVTFYHNGHKICANTFRVLHGIGKHYNYYPEYFLIIIFCIQVQKDSKI